MSNTTGSASRRENAPGTKVQNLLARHNKHRWLGALIAVALLGCFVSGAYAPPYREPVLKNSAQSAGSTKVGKMAITTVFWVGEPADGDNGGIANKASTWDEQWQQHFGGVDSRQARNGYLPAGFTPKENPFYVALPYSDFDAYGNRKPSATLCPNVFTHSSSSWCKNSWIKIQKGNATAYAQWEDAGPFGEDDVAYVFGGSSQPRNTQGARAGLDVSPAVQIYLGLQDVDHTTWSFVAAPGVPSGPWKQVVTTSPGTEVNQ